MGDPEYQFVISSYSFPHHCMSYDSPLDQGCYLIFSINNKDTQERGIFMDYQCVFIFIRCHDKTTMSTITNERQEENTQHVPLRQDAEEKVRGKEPEAVWDDANG